jgi:hypothetical protein
MSLVGVAGPGHTAAQDLGGDARTIEGLWSGSWGGGERDGVIFQPVRVELFVRKDQAELHGFPGVSHLTGTVRYDARARRMRITPTTGTAGQPAPKAIEYTYDLQADTLTLVGADTLPITLQRHRVAESPLANARVEFVAATGIDDAGDLLVTEYRALRAGRAGTVYFQPAKRSLKTRQASILLVQESGLKRVTLAEARRLVRDSTPVAVSYREDDHPAPQQFHELWTDTGPPAPDSEAVQQIVWRMLRPGTLVFVLSARENVPLP